MVVRIVPEVATRSPISWVGAALRRFLRDAALATLGATEVVSASKRAARSKPRLEVKLAVV